MKNYFSTFIFLVILIVFIISILVVKKWKIIGYEGFLEGYDFNKPIIIDDKNNTLVYSYEFKHPITRKITTNTLTVKLNIGTYNNFASFRTVFESKAKIFSILINTEDKLTINSSSKFKIFGAKYTSGATLSTISPLLGMPTTTTSLDSVSNNSQFTLVFPNKFNDVSIPTTPMKTTPMKTTRMPTTPMQTTRMPTTPMQTTRMPTTPMQTTRMPTTPMQTTPMQTTRMPTTPMQTTPMQTTPMQTTPMQTTPMQTTPMQTTRMQTTPFQTTPMQTTPFQTTPFQTTPMQTTPFQTTANPVITINTYNENLKKNSSPNGYVMISTTKPTTPPLKVDPSSDQNTGPSCFFVISNDYYNVITIDIYIYFSNLFNDSNENTIEIEYSYKKDENDRYYFNGYQLISTNYPDYSIGVKKNVNGYINFITYSSENFDSPPIDGKSVFKFQLDYNYRNSDYFDYDNDKCLIEKMVQDNLISGTFSINNFKKDISVTYDRINNYISLPTSLPTLPENTPNLIKMYFAGFNPDSNTNSFKYWGFQNLRTFITIENKPYYNGDVMTLDLYICVHSIKKLVNGKLTEVGSAVGAAAVKLNYDDKYMMVTSMKSNLFVPIDGGGGYFVFGPTGKTNYTTGVGMVHLGSILFTIKNDFNIDTFLSITGQTTSIGGVSGTSYCESKYENSKCSKQNSTYSDILPDTDQCFFIYYENYSNDQRII
jgi:hypothetical protein